MPRLPLPMATVADLNFPIRGLDRDMAFGAQVPMTSPDGVNVQTFEPSTGRMRGGSRAGLGRVVAGRVPEGAVLIQAIGSVVYGSAEALLSADPIPELDPVTGLPPIPDPSSPGDPTSWGGGPLYLDPITGLPVTGEDLTTRVPPGRVIRQGGSGAQPSPNVQVDPPTAIEHRCFRGLLQIEIVKLPPDPFHWNGQRPAFSGGGCFPYQASPQPGDPPIIPGPESALSIPAVTSQLNTFIEEHVGACTYFILRDEVTGPNAVCTLAGPLCP